MRDRGIVSPLGGDDENEATLRPQKLADFTGQARLKENLAVAIEAAKRRDEAMDHVLLYGPPGLGKTTLANIIASELAVAFEQTAGPILQKKLDLTGVLTNIRARQVFFIDEIHRLMPDVEEILYSALEDFRIDILIGSGPGARTHSMPIPRFTAIGATTRQGLVSAPLRGRFGLVLRLNHYDVPELKRIVLRSAALLNVTIDPEGAEEIARRSRGTPRIANRLLRRVRDYAQVRANGHIDPGVATAALDRLEVDRFGLDEIDQKIMMTLLEKYSGGPVGVNTIAASIDEEADTIEEVYEPYLIQLGFIDRTPRGRVGTDRAFDYFKVPRKAPGVSARPFLKIAYLSLGSNIGDRQANLNRAIELIEDSRIQILKKSSRFLTEPRELVEQPWFLNQCVEIQTTLFPLQLLARILGIEREMGRKRLVPKGPRVIDMDILLYGSLQVKTEKLQIPHPRMKERRFVLEPLAEIAPALRIGGMYVRDLLRNVEQQVVKKLECKKEPGAGQAPG